MIPSDRRVYQFRVQRIEARAERPGDRPTMGLVGSADDSLKDGNIVDGPTQVVDQDLYFEARADDSAWSTFRRDVSPRLPERLRSMPVQLTILGIYNLALAVVLYAMAFARFTSIEP